MFVIRATPSEAQIEQMATGGDQKGPLKSGGPARSWWEKGALVVDDDGPAVVDADGSRVPIPVPPAGGRLVESGALVSGGGLPGRSFVIRTYRICDRDGRALAALPPEGFTDQDFQRFAAAAGLEYRVRTERGVPPALPGFVTLWPCIHDEAYRKTHHTHWLARKIMGSKKEWSPYYGGRTYPPMDPSYLAA